MSKTILEHNGELARKWVSDLTIKLSKLENYENRAGQIYTILDWFEHQKSPQAEIRHVIHQVHGHVSYFVIPMFTPHYVFAYLRGYKTRSGDIVNLVECSSDEFKALDTDFEMMMLLQQGLKTLISEMASNLQGQKYLKTHFDIGDETPIKLQMQENDWSTLQQILLSVGQSEKLSPEFLDSFDLHATTEHNINH